MDKNSMSSTNSILSKYFIFFMSPLLIITFLIGCIASAKFIKTGPSADAKSNDCYIEIFNSKVPEREYYELGILEGEGIFGLASVEQVLPKLKEKACQAGGDAIIIKTVQKYVDDSDDEKIHIIATVIKWRSNN